MMLRVRCSSRSSLASRSFCNDSRWYQTDTPQGVARVGEDLAAKRVGVGVVGDAGDDLDTARGLHPVVELTTQDAGVVVVGEALITLIGVEDGRWRQRRWRRRRLCFVRWRCWSSGFTTERQRRRMKMAREIKRNAASEQESSARA